MTKTDLEMIKALGKTIESIAGSAASKEIMDGSDQLTASSSKEAIATWVQHAVTRINTTLNKSARTKVMEACGRNCAARNARVIKAALNRRKKAKTLDAFLAAEQQRPMKGTRLVSDGETLYQIYTPQTYTPPMRCYCSLLRGLPNDQNVSRTYCQCSKAFVQALWEAVLQRPVNVELIHTVIAGDPECKFAIHLK
jgi:hypothetical protein